MDVLDELERPSLLVFWIMNLALLVFFAAALEVPLRSVLWGAGGLVLLSCFYLVVRWVWGGPRAGAVSAVLLPGGLNEYRWVPISPFLCPVCREESRQSVVFGCFRCGARLDSFPPGSIEQELGTPQFDAGSPWLYLPHGIDPDAPWLPGNPRRHRSEGVRSSALLLAGIVGTPPMFLLGYLPPSFAREPAEIVAISWFVGCLLIGVALTLLSASRPTDEDPSYLQNQSSEPVANPWFHANERSRIQQESSSAT